jgi:phosphomannomutase
MGEQMNKSLAYIFDVDGTLTPSRTLMDTEFSKFFFEFCTNNNVYIVTGSDKYKTVEQLGEVNYSMAKKAYQCSGNDVYEGNKSIYSNDWKISEEIRTFLEEMLDESDFKKRIGKHIDERIGLCNFSILGRGTESAKEDREQYDKDRAEYQEFDKKTNERDYICRKFNRRFEYKGVISQVAGSTGIDIMQVGADKGQIIKDFKDVDVKFFGDMMQPGGNDAPLKDAILARLNKNDKCYQVNGWEQTYSLLKEFAK